MVIFDLFPETRRKIPHISLGTFPTPVRKLDRLAAALGLTELWIKRDDVSGPVYGGNKVRKLEFLLADALQRKSGRIVTIGGIGSNHVVATAIYSRKLGMNVTAVMVPQPMNEVVKRNVLVNAAYGVEIVPSASRAAIPYHAGRAMLRHRKERPYLIEPGGSNGRGILGFACAMLELKKQVDAGELPQPASIFVALGSGGSVAGLLLGAAIAGLRTRIYAVRVVERLYATKLRLKWLTDDASSLLRSAGATLPGLKIGREDLEIVHGFFGKGYGHSTREAEDAVRMIRQEEGIELETTYTGKTLASLVAFARERKLQQPVLFWNTFNSRDIRPMVANLNADEVLSRLDGFFSAETGLANRG